MVTEQFNLTLNWKTVSVISWLFLIILQTWQWPTWKPQLLWPLCTSSLDFLSINIWIAHFCKKIIYSVCVRLIHLNSANKDEEVEEIQWKQSYIVGKHQLRVDACLNHELGLRTYRQPFAQLVTLEPVLGFVSTCFYICQVK